MFNPIKRIVVHRKNSGFFFLPVLFLCCFSSFVSAKTTNPFTFCDFKNDDHPEESNGCF